jgi:hypothetical protein
MPAPHQATLFSLAQRTATSGNSSPFSAIWKKAVFLLNVTAAAGDPTDYLDVYIDVLAPDGATWINAAHFTQVAGNSAAIKHYAILDSTAVAATTFNVTSDCASGVTKPYIWGPTVRARYALVATGDVTFSVTGHFIY